MHWVHRNDFDLVDKTHFPRTASDISDINGECTSFGKGHGFGSGESYTRGQSHGFERKNGNGHHLEGFGCGTADGYGYECFEGGISV